MTLLMTGDEDWFVVEDVLMMILTVRVSLFPCRRDFTGLVQYITFHYGVVDLFPTYGAAPLSDMIPKGTFKRLAHCSLVLIFLLSWVAWLCLRVLRFAHTHECVYADLWYFFSACCRKRVLMSFPRSRDLKFELVSWVLFSVHST